MAPRHENHLGRSRATALHGRAMVVLDSVHAPCYLLVGETLFVVAFHICHSRSCCAVVFYRVHAVQIRIRGISHGKLASGVVDIGPVELAVLRHLVLLLGRGKVLVDEISLRIHLAHGGVQALHALYAAFVVGICAGFARIGV